MKITYKDAGVDTKKAGLAIKGLKNLISSTNDENVIDAIGSFGSMYRLGDDILISGTDGVGTKLMLAKDANDYKNIGYDLVAMCVNDVICHGAKPLFFLDYIAMGNMQQDMYEEVIISIINACKQAEVSLVGGESAEMPDMYSKDDIDLAGFCVGIVKENKIITGKNIEVGDSIIGIYSNGIHSNGFSLVRKLIDKFSEELRQYKEEFLKPTYLYTKVIKNLIKDIDVKGIAHITGGGFFENIPRIMPKGLNFHIDKSKLYVPEIFKKLCELAHLNTYEAYSTFNMGYGMIFVVDKKDVEKSIEIVKKNGFNADCIGSVIKSNEGIIK